MNRCTEWRGEHAAVTTNYVNYIDRLAQYEDTGLEPCEVTAIQKQQASRKTVVEYCPECETEIEMVWDVEKMGYKAFCPVCGNRLMLCDECRHSGPNGGPVGPCDYDHQTDTCRFNPGKPQEGGN